ncbi:alpha/beta fold hydrolase [Subtercola endophyticus]|uniref:alpha/beta fold hydrolase n=1 Tax=Subtercola endophyticus TaxID=2895559 RepID=UPI001E458A12|nr:alpha/beta fold hydrolase [Subtercola endophyticus]UFS57527.1 alpha/beta fold hydrolase [Subtercola endophyticus]
MTTHAGTKVAFSSWGSGRPIVYVTGWLSHLELSWQLRQERAFYESLARDVRLVRYDRAGCGLSAPLTQPPSLALELEQLSAVVGTLGEDPFDLVGTSMGAVVAAAWAAEHPQRVRRLVLYGGWVRGADVAEPGAQQNILGLIQSHWGLGSDVLTDLFAPDADAATRLEFGRYQRASSTAETARALLALSYSLDIGEQLAQVRAPTLVVRRERDRAAPVAQARLLAAGIPGAELVVLPGRSHLPYIGDSHALVTAMRRFLGLRVPRRGATDLTPRQREVAALVSDGCTNKTIASRLGITERSAEGHVERIRQRLGVGSRAQIAAWYAGEKLR